MNIELKGLKLFPKKNKQSNAFKADVYADGIKVAKAENDGSGRYTSFTAYEGNEDLLNDLRKYCDSLPNSEFGSNKEDGGKPYSIKMNLPLFIDKMVYAEATKK